LQEIDPVLRHHADDAVLLCKPPRPGSTWNVPERFRLSNAVEWVAKDRFRYVERAQGDLAIRLDPKAKILDELRLKDGGSLLARRTVTAPTLLPLQVRDPPAVPRWMKPECPGLWRARSPSATVQRSWAISKDERFRADSQRHLSLGLDKAGFCYAVRTANSTLIPNS